MCTYTTHIHYSIHLLSRFNICTMIASHVAFLLLLVSICNQSSLAGCLGLSVAVVAVSTLVSFSQHTCMTLRAPTTSQPSVSIALRAQTAVLCDAVNDVDPRPCCFALMKSAIYTR
jgi:hypothetical protein